MNTRCIFLSAAWALALTKPLVLGHTRGVQSTSKPGCIAWLTGLSGAGKTTLALSARDALRARGHTAVVLDGDLLRRQLSADLGFSPADRDEQNRRARALAVLLASQGVSVVVALISPYAAQRQAAQRAAHETQVPFLEVYLSASLAVCEARDVKGLYARARRGDLLGFTGIDAPYEAPQTADLVLPTGTETLGICLDRLVQRITAAVDEAG